MSAHPAYIKIGGPSRRQKKSVPRTRRKMELCSEDSGDFKKEEKDTEIKSMKEKQGNWVV